MKKIAYPAIINKNSDKGFTISFPDLPGCISYGDDIADTMLMANDAASGWIIDELEENKRIPVPTDPAEIKLENGDLLCMVVIDIDRQMERLNQKTVKKNTTIPAFLNSFGESKNLNFSKILTDALMEMYLNS